MFRVKVMRDRLCTKRLDLYDLKLRIHECLSFLSDPRRVDPLIELQVPRFYAILFGSVAKGFHDCDSDIDIAIRPLSEYDLLDFFIIEKKLHENISPRISITILDKVEANEMTAQIFKYGIPLFFTDLYALKAYYEDMHTAGLDQDNVHKLPDIKSEILSTLSHAKQTLNLISKIYGHGSRLSVETSNGHTENITILVLFNTLAKYVAKAVYLLARMFNLNVRNHEEAWRALVKNGLVKPKYAKLLAALVFVGVNSYTANNIIYVTHMSLYHDLIIKVMTHMPILNSLLDALMRLVT